MDSRLKPFGLLFNKSLNDMIRGMRKRKDPELLAEYLRRTIAECREEAKSPDLDVKAMAVLKLAYLEMYGFDMAWAGFNVLEVMSSQQFQQKRIGYLAAMQSFRDSELLMMATNLLKTDLSSSSLPRVAIALSGLASIVTPFLAQDISDDLIKMLNHSKPYVRKKALLAMYKLVLQYPEVFEVVIGKIKGRLELEDEDPSVISAAVNVLCELANQVPATQLVQLAPSLYELLSSSKNNWCLIKILKLFAKLCPAEKRLVAKVRPRVVELMESTDALSLKYECINCILRGSMLDQDDYALAGRCTSHIRTLMEEHDQNLKFVGLLALNELLRINKEFLAGEDILLVTDAINDNDPSIRNKALGMLRLVVTEDNIYDLVTRLIEQLREDQYENVLQLAETVRDLCAMNNYEYLPNFEWYTEILVELMVLAHPHRGIGEIIGYQLRNMAVRVKSARNTVVNASVTLSLNKEIIKKQPGFVSYTMWLVGEYIGDYFTSANAATGPDFIASLMTIHPVAESVPAIAKVFNAWVSVLNFWSPEQADTVANTITKIIDYLTVQSVSPEAELQERASQFLELFRLGLESIDHTSQEPPALLTVAFPSLFDLYDIKPIGANALRRVQVPEELDLTTPIPLPEITWDQESQDEEEISEIEESPPVVNRKIDPYYIPMQDGNISGDLSPEDNASTPEPQLPAAATPAAAAAPPPKRRVQRVKVDIVQDEDDDEPFAAAVSDSKKSLFQLGSRLSSIELNTSSDPSEVKVKHKTKKKKKEKSKSKKE